MPMIFKFILALSLVQQSSGGLAARISDLSQRAGGRVGAAAMLLETAETVAVHGDERFPMQSVYKLPIAMAVLREVDDRRLELERKIRVEKSEMAPAGLHSPIRDKYPTGVELSVRELLRFTVSESDGTASDVLLRLAGGPDQVTAYLRGLSVEGITVATSESEMARDEMVQYRNWATPTATLALLKAVHEGRGLSASSRELLLRLMTETGTGPRRIKGMLPAGTVVAHKTGTSWTKEGLTRATNDVGIIQLPDGRHLAIAAFVSDSRADEETRERVIARISRAAWDYWTAQTRGLTPPLMTQPLTQYALQKL
jgi:beta-lactamase class A